MAERSSGPAKRPRSTTTRRRRTDAPDESTPSSDASESAASIRAEHESTVARPQIDDVLDEVNLTRKSLQEEGGDEFGVGIDGEAPPAPRRTRRAAAPRTAAPRATTRRAAAPRAEKPVEAPPVEPPVTQAVSFGRIDDDFDDEVPSYGERRSLVLRNEPPAPPAPPPAVSQPAPAPVESNSGNDFYDDFNASEDDGAFPQTAGDAAPDAGGDTGGPSRRRRRRRGRGGRGDGQQGPGPQGGQYGNQPQGQQQLQPRHPQQHGGGRQPHNRGPQQGGGRRPYGNDRGMQDRGGYGQRQDHHRRAPQAYAPIDGPDHISRGPEVTQPAYGVLELHPKGYGFLRDGKAGYVSQVTDVFVSSSQIEKYRLREGCLVLGECIPGGRGQGPRLRSVEAVEGRTPEEWSQVRSFEDLTPISPHQQIKLEIGATPVTMRVMDLLSPIAKGQRALLVAPPRSGKTMLLQEIAESVSTNHPEITLIVLLIDERPEEVTEMRRHVRGEVIASSMDREVESHIRVSQLVFERAKRLAECGKDVFVLLDSITRTARAFNKYTNSGRTGSGGVDVKAMDIPKKLFGTARQFEEGGSLTVVGTALIETGGRMDEVIFQEFKGTGNMELVLSRDLADRRIWPAIDISKSGTRREEKILPPDVLEGVTMLRRSLISLSPVEAMEQLIRILGKYKTNAEFLSKVRQML